MRDVDLCYLLVKVGDRVYLDLARRATLVVSDLLEFLNLVPWALNWLLLYFKRNLNSHFVVSLRRVCCFFAEVEVQLTVKTH